MFDIFWDARIACLFASLYISQSEEASLSHIEECGVAVQKELKQHESNSKTHGAHAKWLAESTRKPVVSSNLQPFEEGLQGFP